MKPFSRWTSGMSRLILGIAATVVTFLTSFGGGRVMAAPEALKTPVSPQPQPEQVMPYSTSAQDLLPQNIQDKTTPTTPVLVTEIRGGGTVMGINRNGAYYSHTPPDSIHFSDGTSRQVDQNIKVNISGQSVATERMIKTDCRPEDLTKVFPRSERTPVETGVQINLLRTNPEVCHQIVSERYDHPTLTPTAILDKGMTFAKIDLGYAQIEKNTQKTLAKAAAAQETESTEATGTKNQPDITSDAPINTQAPTPDADISPPPSVPEPAAASTSLPQPSPETMRIVQEEIAQRLKAIREARWAEEQQRLEMQNMAQVMTDHSR